MIKIYIIGSIATRGCFSYSSKDVYDDIYDISGIQYQSSIISLMSKACNVTNYNINNISGWNKKTVCRDFNKIFLKELISLKPDYIILDLISDVQYDLISIENSYVTNIKGKTNKIGMDLNNLKVINIFDNKDEYLNLFKQSFDKFKLFIKENLPNTKLIIHKAKFAYSYLDECMVARSFKNLNLIEKNRLLDEIYSYCTKDLMIEMDDKAYFSNIKHPISLNPIHYSNDYYTDFHFKLNKIVLKSLINS